VKSAVRYPEVVFLLTEIELADRRDQPGASRQRAEQLG
jgi:hypothetical protein